ncbi:MAG: peptidase C39 family protein [Haliea sp.]|jgi:ribosomal protein S18 acetylase RimI-like enzyme
MPAQSAKQFATAGAERRPDIRIERALPADLEALLAIETACFSSDRLSRRSFKRWLRRTDCVFLVARDGAALAGYCLVLLRRGTRLARLYSLAVAPGYQGLGLARRLLQQAERDTRTTGALYLRLEVASSNSAAIALYRQLGYAQFGLYHDYYEDHDDALRMEKCIRPYEPGGDSHAIPWLAQTTPFTCGPASLMMAMAGLDSSYQPTPLEEIEIWREATTIFMTSGHGGCHPLGLALAASARGFRSEVWVNTPGPLFLEGVRDENKKRVMNLVHDAFVAQCERRDIPVHCQDIDQQQLVELFDAGANILILISTYRLDSKKAPHWVVLSGYDDSCLYVHDPELDDLGTAAATRDANKAPLDCQHLPIARADFAAMSRFGGSRLRAAVVVQAAKGRRRGKT